MRVHCHVHRSLPLVSVLNQISSNIFTSYFCEILFKIPSQGGQDLSYGILSFPTKTVCISRVIFQPCYISLAFYDPRFDHLTSIRRRVQIIKFLIFSSLRSVCVGATLFGTPCSQRPPLGLYILCLTRETKFYARIEQHVTFHFCRIIFIFCIFG